MKRLAFKFIGVLSLLLCISTAVLWARSYWVADLLMNETGPGSSGSPGEPIWLRQEFLLCSHGGIQLQDRYDRWFLKLVTPGAGIYWTQSGPPNIQYPLFQTDPVMGAYRGAQTPPPRTISAMGFEFVIPAKGIMEASLPFDRAYSATIPLWFPAAVFAAIAFFSLKSTRRFRGAGLCHSCGYDLRATPDRCPECGTAVMEEKA